MTLLTSIAENVLKLDMERLRYSEEACMESFTSSYKLLLTELNPKTSISELSTGRSAKLKCKSIANKLANLYKTSKEIKDDHSFLSYLNTKVFESSKSKIETSKKRRTNAS